MRVAVAGSSGLIGRALVSALTERSDDVVTLVRRGPVTSAHIVETQWDPASGALDTSALTGTDAVVNLCGVGIGDRRWSNTRKEAILESRVVPTRLLSRALAELPVPPNVLVNASAVGLYGDRGDELLTESSSPGSGFTAGVCRAWEAATAPAEEAGIRVVHLRTAVVLDVHGGVLARQLPLFRLGLGGRLGNGEQWFSWISLHDEISVILHVIADDSLSGALNSCSPNPVTNAAFTRALGQALHRPALLRVPDWALHAALGRELADELALCSQRVLPHRLEESRFAFRDPHLERALEAIAGS